MTRFAQWLARLLARILLRLRVDGIELIPPGGALLAVNHASLLDGPLVFGQVPRPATFLVKASVFRGPIGAFLRRIGQIPVRRDVPERAPLLAALDTLAVGGLVGIFPEGSRGSGTLEEVRHGVAYLALRSGCPVVPVACVGTGAILPKGRRWPRFRQPATVAFGKPVDVADLGRVASRRTVTEAADRIRRVLVDHLAATAEQHAARGAR